MTDSSAVQVAMISAVGAVLTALVNSGFAFLTHRKLHLLEKNTNSMKDALVKLTGEKAFNEGLKQGREEK